MTSPIVDRFDIAPEEGIKAPCRMATTANITLSGLQTIDTIAGADGDRVLVKDQTDATENGIYQMRSTAWNRASDWNDNLDVSSGVLVALNEGSQSSDIYRVSFSGTYEVGVTAITFTGISGPGQVTFENLNANGDIGFGAGQVPEGDEIAGQIVTRVTFENLNANGDIGFGAAQVPQGNLVPQLTQNTFTGIQRWSKGADVASAATLTVGTDGNTFDVTGATNISAIASVGVGATIKLHFDAALTLVHHATDLILPGGLNVTTAAGDEFEFTEYQPGDWRCTAYTLASGEAIVAGATGGQLLHLQDRKTSGTSGGAATAGSWETRDLNTIVVNAMGGSPLSSNQITLSSGTYRAVVRVPHYFGNYVQSRLLNVTDTTALLIGSSIRCNAAVTVFTQISGDFTLVATKTIEVQQRASSTDANGFGIAVGGQFAVGFELYTDCRIWKIA